MTVREVTIKEMGYRTEDKHPFIEFEVETRGEPGGRFDIQFAARRTESGLEFAVLDRTGLLASTPPDDSTLEFLDAVIEEGGYQANYTYLGEDGYGETVGMGGNTIELSEQDLEQMQQIKELLA